MRYFLGGESPWVGHEAAASNANLVQMHVDRVTYQVFLDAVGLHEAATINRAPPASGTLTWTYYRIGQLSDHSRKRILELNA
jgi:hypothetical protein